MLVRIVKNWTGSDLFRQTPGHSQMWDGIEFTESNTCKCDLLVVLNAPPRPLLTRVAPEARWLFSHESPIVPLYQWHTRSFRHFSRVYTFWDERYSPNIIHSQTALPWFVHKSYDELVALGKTEALRNKTKTLSWITSDAKEKEGHILRMAFKDFLLDEGFPFDLYGKGFTPIEDKFDGLWPYKYSIAIENYSCNDYWTEKISDCFLSWTMPIYYGAKSIRKYFPEKSMILIDPNDPQRSLAIIKEAIDGNLFEKNMDYIEEARNLVLNKYQLFPMIAGEIKASGIDFSHRKWCFIPRNIPPQRYLFRAKRLLGRIWNLPKK